MYVQRLKFMYGKLHVVSAKENKEVMAGGPVRLNWFIVDNDLYWTLRYINGHCVICQETYPAKWSHGWKNRTAREEKNVHMQINLDIHIL